jgi:hypothetical protein
MTLLLDTDHPDSAADRTRGSTADFMLARIRLYLGANFGRRFNRKLGAGGGRPGQASRLTPVVFVQGLWLLSSSWQPWRDLFESNGYTTLAPGWPGRLRRPSTSSGTAGRTTFRSPRPTTSTRASYKTAGEEPGTHRVLRDARSRPLADHRPRLARGRRALGFVRRFTTDQQSAGPTEAEPAG